MIATKPSDLYWRTGPLPEPAEHLVVLAWIAGTLANHWLKVFASPALGSLRWATGDHIPVETLGEVHFWAVLRDEPYRGYVKLADADRNDLTRIVDHVGVEGGCLVAAQDVGQGDVLQAQGRGDVWEDARGFRYVRLPADWLRRHLRSARGASGVEGCA